MADTTMAAGGGDVTGTADRWQVLKEYLDTQIRQDLATAESFQRGGPTASAHFALVSANRSTLGMMRKLEASASETGQGT